ncbi:hypothetical protein [Catellatospora sp. NPDC049609]
MLSITAVPGARDLPDWDSIPGLAATAIALAVYGEPELGLEL